MKSEHAFVNFHVLFQGDNFDAKFQLDTSLNDVSNELLLITGALPETQKFLLPRKHTSAAAITLMNSTQSLRDIEISNGDVIRLIGATSEDIKHVSFTDRHRIIGFEEEVKRARSRRIKKGDDAKSSSILLPSGPYTFMSFSTLQLDGREFTPPASSALRLLHRLASDNGIVSVMKKHKWQVSLLSEMKPEGLVGVSPVCLLGVNKNQGEEISIRLRTDDLKGFRKYETIKETLLHELTHMVHGDHDIHFKTLLSQITNEANSLDWTKSNGHRLMSGWGKNAHASMDEMEEDEDEEDDDGDDVMSITKKSSGMKLGGRRMEDGNHNIHVHEYNDVHHQPSSSSRLPSSSRFISSPLPPKFAAVESAIRRFSEKGEEKLQLEGDGDRHGLDEEMKREEEGGNEKEKEGNEKEKKENEKEKEKVEDKDKDVDEMEEDDVDGIELREERNAFTMDETDNMVETNKGKKEGEEMEKEEEENNVKNDIDNNDNNNINNNIEKNNDINDISYNNNNNHDSSNNNANDNNIDELSESELSLLQDSSLLLQKNISFFLLKLKKEVENETHFAITLSSLSKIIGNVIQNPKEAKFRQLRMDNSSFFQKVGKYSAAIDLLKAVGFQEKMENERKLILKEMDLGRLWLSSSVLNSTFT